MARVLVIDDDPSLLDVLSMALEEAGHDVLTAADGSAGWSRVQGDKPDVVIADVNMPGVDGFTLCRRLRERGNQVPVILLTTRDGEIDEALGLELGADDYVTKPFSTRVLIARVGALIRRDAMSRAPGEGPVTVLDGVEILPDRMEVRFHGSLVRMTLSEFRLLEALMTRPGRVLTRTQLLHHVRGDDSVVGERIIDTYVRRIRKKLQAVDVHFDRIETMVGMGYRWSDGPGRDS
jgi:DNA-binding response OmpR family regulator